MPEYLVNPWVSFLRQYGPIPRNDNMYDESIQRSIRRKKIVPLRLETGDRQTLVENFSGPEPSSVVLTGTAGDGKTYLCREVWEALGGAVKEWEIEAKTHSLQLPSGISLVVIKDLSEFKAEEYGALTDMALSVLSPKPSTVFLIAANDGQLVEAWHRAPSSPEVDSVRACIEELLVSGRARQDGKKLLLYNLSRRDTAHLFFKITEEISKHSGWQGCDGCRGQLPEPQNRCPIWENFRRLQDPLLVQRLSQILELCDRSEFHLPMRQMLLLASNALLGHPKAKDGLLNCADVPDIVGKQLTAEGSIYSNLLGGNLSSSRRVSTDVMQILGKFGLGEETSNRVDNLLVFGGDEPNLLQFFDRLIRADELYGGHPDFLRLQAGYLEGTDPDAIGHFLAALPAQRQRLFFTMPLPDAENLHLWDLTVFQYAGEYLEQLVRPLEKGDKAPRQILARLIRGMNRIFTGLLSTTDHELVLASSGSFSQARISRIEEYSIPVDPRRGEKIVLDYVGGHVQLVVHFDPDHHLGLALNVLRYEFLSRVAEGALPSSFSRECYEDILSFKSRLLRDWMQLRNQYGEDGSAPDEMQLRLLDLDQRGKLVTKNLTVRL
jgi:hypothetical protein